MKIVNMRWFRVFKLAVYETPFCQGTSRISTTKHQKIEKDPRRSGGHGNGCGEDLQRDANNWKKSRRLWNREVGNI